MILTVFERANLLNVLPKEGNFKTLRTIRQLQEMVSLSDEENEKWQPKIVGPRMEWRTEDDDGNAISEEADIPISEHGCNIIREALIAADGASKLQLSHYSLYEKFVEKEKE